MDLAAPPAMNYPAHRVAWLIDGAAYFENLREALRRARYSVLMLGWDFDSHLTLVGEQVNDDLPVTLGPFLDALLEATPGLEVHILEWDYLLLMQGDREWLPRYQLGWRTHQRLHFHLDDQHPAGACHHQKVVVVDDRIAFCGGMDLRTDRWDVPAHQVDEPRRQDKAGDPAQPYHDVQMAVDGAAAAALGDLARQRWLAATGGRLRPPPDQDDLVDPWPPGLLPDVEEAGVAVLRTQPAYGGQSAVREVQSGFLEAIAGARRCIYIENQYFTARRVGDALAAHLVADEGPEVLLVLPLKTEGWLSESTMDALREKVIRDLIAADLHQRLRVCYPQLHQGEAGGSSLNLHSKVLIVDDELARVGSANLNNRSMWLDTECDLVVEARGRRDVRAAIAGLRARLLAEHSGTTVEAVSRTCSRHRSLLDAVAALTSGDRRLRTLPLGVAPRLDPLIQDARLVDPEQPADRDRLIADLTPKGLPALRHAALWVPAVILLATLTLAVAWHWTPLGQQLDLPSLLVLAERFQGLTWAPLLALVVFVVASVLAAPVTLLILLCVLIFGPVAGSAYSFAGSLLSAALSYLIGRWSGRGLVRRLAGARVEQLDRRLERPSLLMVAAVRMIPIAPFCVVNLAAGALTLRFRDYIGGTALGMGPGILAIAVFTDRLVASIQNPSATTFAILLAVTGGIIGFGYLLYRWLRHRARAGSRRGLRTRRASATNGADTRHV